MEDNSQLCLDYILNTFGTKKIPTDPHQSRVSQIISKLLAGETITGCRLYKTSVAKDGTPDYNFKTIVLTTYVNTLAMRSIDNKARYTILNPAFRVLFSDYFNKVISSYSSEESEIRPCKVNITKNIQGYKPAFVKEHHVLVKVVIKLPNSAEEINSVQMYPQVEPVVD